MIVHRVAQGTPEWLQLRCGIPTASMFDRILTPGGKESSSAPLYMYSLLAERCMGHPIQEHVSLYMKRGNEMEADARAFYEFNRDVTVEPVGLCMNDAGTIGASPDGLVGDDGLLEIKCPSESQHMAYLLTDTGAYKAYKPQVQGQLWITGRKWVDVLSFHPELPEALIRIDRDEEYIGKLDAAVTAFSRTLEAYSEEVMKKGWMKQPEQFVPRSTQDLIQAMRDSLNARH